MKILNINNTFIRNKIIYKNLFSILYLFNFYCEMILKISDNGQSAGNIINNNNGSSETTCEASLNSLNKDFLFWFIGFVEGKGSFIVSNDVKFFIIKQKELVVLYKIKEFLKRGRVQQHGTCFRFIITKKKDIIFLKNLFLNNIKLNKVCLMLEFFYNENNNSFKNKSKSFLNNSWLSGLIDAEGYFYISLLKRTPHETGYKIKIQFILDQKLLGNDVDFLNLLLKSFNNLGFVLYRGDSNFRLVLKNSKSIEILINYLKNYPLKTHKKSIDYKKWLRCFRIKQKSIQTEKDIEYLKKVESWRYSPVAIEKH